MRDQQLYPDGRWVAGESTLPVRNPTSLRAQGMGDLDHSALL